jgi:hypothetical protein
LAPWVESEVITPRKDRRLFGMRAMEYGEMGASKDEPCFWLDDGILGKKATVSLLFRSRIYIYEEPLQRLFYFHIRSQAKRAESK